MPLVIHDTTIMTCFIIQCMIFFFRWLHYLGNLENLKQNRRIWNWPNKSEKSQRFFLFFFLQTLEKSRNLVKFHCVLQLNVVFRSPEVKIFHILANSIFCFKSISFIQITLFSKFLLPLTTTAHSLKFLKRINTHFKDFLFVFFEITINNQSSRTSVSPLKCLLPSPPPLYLGLSGL